MRGEVTKVANVAPPVSSILNAVGEHIRGYPHICALSFAASEEKKSAFHCRSGVRWMDSLSSDRTEEQNDYPLWQISYELLEVVWNLLETSLTDVHFDTEVKWRCRWQMVTNERVVMFNRNLNSMKPVWYRWIVLVGFKYVVLWTLPNHLFLSLNKFWEILRDFSLVIAILFLI